MWLRRILVLLLALAAAGSTTVYVRTLIERERAPEAVAARAEPPTREVLVAVHDLLPGTLLGEADVRWQPWPEELVDGSWIVRGAPDAEDVAGSVVRARIPAGAPVVPDALVKPGERGFLAAILRPGHVALTVPVDDAFAEAGPAQPGDHVDVLLVQDVGDPERGTSRPAAELLVADSRVLAIGPRLQPAGDGEVPGGRRARSATLELSPEDARRVALAMDLGRVVLAVRSLARASHRDDGGDAVAVETPADPVVYAEEASRARRDAAPVLVFRGSEVSEVRVLPAANAVAADQPQEER